VDQFLSGALNPLIERLFLGMSAALAAIVIYQVMQATLERPGLLSAIRGAPAQGERVVMVVATLAAAGAYVHQCLGTRPWPIDTLPEPHDWIVWIAAGGQASYLVGKLLRLPKGEDS
jgi:hypothetical protein